jgi:hypothetical protein
MNLICPVKLAGITKGNLNGKNIVRVIRTKFTKLRKEKRF